VRLDEKFYYSSLSNASDSFEQNTDKNFSNNIKEEANRVIIQRAFGHLNPERLDSLSIIPYSFGSFYGEPTLVVYPADFFFLPDAGEIIREVVPRVRFKKSKSQCEIIVSHPEKNISSRTPLVLLDGIRVKNLSDLQLLNSDHIQRIEVQSGLRVAGNYFYNGMVAFYTTDDYRLKKKDGNYDNSYNIPGYTYSPDYSIVFNEYVSTKAKHPDFKNQLFWKPDMKCIGHEKAKIDFVTSDELGEFILEISGFTEKGMQIRHQETFFIVQ
jgi:hypothetical protein